MKRIPLTQGKVALIDDRDFARVKKRKWHFHNWQGGYAMSRREKLHRFILRAKPGQYVDHINGNGLDNRRKNLRFCTLQQNCWNRKFKKVAASGQKGVYRSSSLGRTYRARIRVGAVLHHLGTFLTLEQAARAYRRAALKHFGKFVPNR